MPGPLGCGGVGHLRALFVPHPCVDLRAPAPTGAQHIVFTAEKALGNGDPVAGVEHYMQVGKLGKHPTGDPRVEQRPPPVSFVGHHHPEVALHGQGLGEELAALGIVERIAPGLAHDVVWVHGGRGTEVDAELGQQVIERGAPGMHRHDEAQAVVGADGGEFVIGWEARVEGASHLGEHHTVPPFSGNDGRRLAEGGVRRAAAHRTPQCLVERDLHRVAPSVRSRVQ